MMQVTGDIRFYANDGCILEDCKSGVVLPVYKDGSYAVECFSYGGIKLLEHAVKVVERFNFFRHIIR